MKTTGIDIGASEIRAAVRLDKGPAVIARKEMPLLIDSRYHPNDITIQKPRLIFLKSLLDFDTLVPIGDRNVNSIDAFSKEFVWIKDHFAGSSSDKSDNFVISVPSCFSQRQRAAVLAAAQKADLSRVKLVNDITATLLACAESIKGCNSILVYSWGAAAFSVSLFKLTQDGLQTIVQEGTLDLGGEAIDSAIFRHILRDKAGNSSVGQLNDTESISGLAEEAKRIRNTVWAEKRKEKQQDKRENSADMEVDSQSMAVMKNVFHDTLDSMRAETFKLVDKILSTTQNCKPEVVILSGKMACFAETKNALEVKLGIRSVEASGESVAIGALLYGETVPQVEWEKAESDFLEAKTQTGTTPVFERRTGTVEQLPVSDKAVMDGWAADFLPLLREAENQYKQNHILEAINTVENLRIALNKFNVGLYRSAALKCESSGQLDEALKILKEAGRYSPSNPLIVFDFVKLCCEKANMYLKERVGGLNNVLEVIEHAVRELEKLPKADDNSQLLAKMLHIQGWALCRDGGQSNLKKAAKLMQHSAELDPSQLAYKQDHKKVQEALKKHTKLATPVTPIDYGHDRDRNHPCPCGSGEKYKKCCGAP